MSLERPAPNPSDEWAAQIGRLHASATAGLWLLWAEWLLTVIVLFGCGFVVVGHYDTAIDSAAVAVTSTVIGYWFGRSVSRGKG